MSLKDRFSNMVRKSADGCWIWIGSRNNGGYGRIREDGNGKTMLAHRVSWILHRGELPRDILVLHRCDVRECVNPNHLFLGTYKDNAIDREKKGRGANQKGENNHASVLTESLVLRLRTMRDSGLKYREISERTGVSETTIVNACLHTWRHVKERIND